MILVFDVGNTETTVGLFDARHLAAHWRVMTAPLRTADEMGALLISLLHARGIEPGVVRGAALGSVVPAATAPLVDACHDWLGVPVRVIDAASPLPIELAVEEPLSVGADRVLNTLAASRLYRTDTIVVDLGTATTFDCITGDGVFLGGVIAPGVITALETLVRRTAKLPATEPVAPERVIGRRTEECIRAGVVLGAADAIDGLVRRIRHEWPTPTRPHVVATGGLADRMAPLCAEVERVEPFLTLTGLRMAHELLAVPRPD